MRNPFDTIPGMNGNAKLREVLSAIMDAQQDTPTTLGRKAGIPSATISRFLAGKHAEPTGNTIRKLANAYGITESQLRGDTPLLMDLTVKPVISRDLASMLSSDERKVLLTLRLLSRKSREAWITIGKQLTQAEENQAATRDEPAPEQGEIFNDPLVRSEPRPEPTRNEDDGRIQAKA